MKKKIVTILLGLGLFILGFNMPTPKANEWSFEREVIEQFEDLQDTLEEILDQTESINQALRS